MVIDEIHLAPELLSPIKVVVDLEPAPGRFLAAGLLASIAVGLLITVVYSSACRSGCPSPRSFHQRCGYPAGFRVAGSSRSRMVDIGRC
jgi:hypothetical protein